MNVDSSKAKRIAVIGGGISGLAAAHRIVELDPKVELALFEASDRLGGVIQTEQHDGFLVERGGDMFTTREPWALELCQRIGFEDQLINTNAAQRRAFIVRQGKLVEVPQGFTLMSPSRLWPILTTPLLSVAGKLRLAKEIYLPAKSTREDESLASFAIRRFGQQTFERIIQPMIGGIYTADPTKLSMAATMSQFVEMEQEHGSVIRGMRKKNKQKTERASGARYGMFLAPRAGLSSLIQAIADRLPKNCIQLNTPLESLCRDPQGWRLGFAGKAKEQIYDGVVLCTPARHSSCFLQPIDKELAATIDQISSASAAVVLIGLHRKSIQHPLNGFGFIVPAVERRRILAGSFSSVKFENRARPDEVLLRIFVGGALQEKLLELDDDEIKKLVFEEVRELIGVRGAPLFCDVARWHQGMPQYHVGHLELVAQIEKRVAKISGLEVAGNAYRGVGIPFCIHSGEQAAARVLGTPQS